MPGSYLFLSLQHLCLIKEDIVDLVISALLEHPFTQISFSTTGMPAFSIPVMLFPLPNWIILLLLRSPWNMNSNIRVSVFWLFSMASLVKLGPVWLVFTDSQYGWRWCCKLSSLKFGEVIFKILYLVVPFIYLKCLVKDNVFNYTCCGFSTLAFKTGHILFEKIHNLRR